MAAPSSALAFNPAVQISTTIPTEVHTKPDQVNHPAQEPSGPTAAYGSDHAAIALQKAMDAAKIRERLHLSKDHKLLWQILDQGKGEVHHKVKQDPFFQSISSMHPKMDMCSGLYTKYLTSLLPIHEALEEAQKALLKINHLKGFVVPELFRSEGIKTDHTFWKEIGPEKYRNLGPYEGAKKYAEYIKSVSLADPERIVGIMYALYGTIMAGGQLNRSKVDAKAKLSKDIFDVELTKKLNDLSLYTGIALFEISQNGKMLSEEDLATFKLNWHERLSKTEIDRPADAADPGLEKFREKLKKETVHAMESLLEIVQNGVEKDGHC